MADFTKAVEGVLQREGTFSDQLTDRGGKTNYGISQKQYPNLDLASLTRERAIEIYRRDYWQPQFDKIASQKVAFAPFRSLTAYPSHGILRMLLIIVD
ncbi:MAG: hypothetical protein HOO98_15500 [Nitrospira sp.]|nr:hypothetical protein [Nitrospira sp.]